jgi:hypothetical protein
MIVLPLAIHVVEEISAMKLPIAVSSREYPVPILRTGEPVMTIQTVNGLVVQKVGRARIFQFLNLKSALMELIMIWTS